MNVQLLKAKIYKLGFPSRNFDLVFSWAVLIYIAPDRIHQVITELVRVSRKRILLAEFHDGSLTESKFDNHWVYNYSLLFKKHSALIKSVNISRIPEMNQGDWGKYGSYIEVSLF